jgi:glucose-6-phosphate isomerase
VSRGSEAWTALQTHHQKVCEIHLRALFADDPGRGERLAFASAGLYLDYSKNRVTDETLRLLVALAEAAGLRARIDAMFAGEKINVTERRAVLHVALRTPRGRRILVDGVDVVPGVHAVLARRRPRWRPRVCPSSRCRTARSRAIGRAIPSWPPS